MGEAEQAGVLVKPRLVSAAPVEATSLGTLPSLGDYWQPVRDRWWFVIAAVLLTATAVGGLTWLQAPEFEATASIIIGREPPRFLGDQEDNYRLEDGPRGRFEYQQYMETQYHVLRSRPVLERVVSTLEPVGADGNRPRLQDDPVFLGLAPEELADHTVEDRLAMAVNVLERRTRVTPVEGSQVVKVVVWDYDRQLAAQLANAVVDQYRGYTHQQSSRHSTGAIDWLAVQETGLEVEVDEAETALYDFRTRHQLLTTPLADRLDTVTQRVEQLGRELTEAEVHRIEMESEWSAVRDLSEAGHLEAAQRIGSDPLIQALKGDLVELEQRLAEMSARRGEAHKEVRSLQAEVDYTRERLLTEAQRLVDGLHAGLEEARTREQLLTDRLEDQTSRAVEVSRLEVEYGALKREVDNSRDLFEMLLERHKTIELAAKLDTSNIAIHELARAPKQQARPRLALNLAFGMILGLFLGFAGAMGLDRLDHSVRDEQELEDRLGLTVVGEIPAVDAERLKPQEGEPPLLPSQSPTDLFVRRRTNSQFAEAFRGLRTNLLFSAPAGKLRSFVVTSPGMREGKTSVATNLALTLADTGKRVMVVDTDLRRPRVHKVFGLSNDRGLTEVLAGAATLDEVVVAVEENVDVLRCGPITPKPSEMLASHAFAGLVKELEKRYDVVIFDSPPAAVVSDASILSQWTDGVLLVVRMEKTPMSWVTRATRQLEAVSAQMIGVVVNANRQRRRSYGYGYGHGYGRHGYYGQDGDEAEEA
jgi:capsular exopolysaccharide synthesis family protein